MIDAIATVERNDELAPGYKLMTLSFDEEIEVQAGQFAMLRALGAFEPLLRRAFAIYRREGLRRLSFLYQVLGRGTEALARLSRSERVEALIPLGNSWFSNSTTNGLHRAIIVAGGIGSAPLLMLCQQLKRMQVNTQIFFGAANRSAAKGCGLEDFRALRLPMTISTDDGSLGERGFVTAPLERYLVEGNGVGATVYACGPWAMMRRVAEIAAAFDLRCLVSLEAPMGCGFGVCVGCVVAIRTDGPTGYETYKRVCVDGTIFSAETICWEINAMLH
jgi:dihydroorotate dehydrogenase electron transfer subunit